MPQPAPVPVEESATARAAAIPAGSLDRVADGIVDRNGDGRIDLWIYRQDGEIVRKALDENHDGRPDRILHYDPSLDPVMELSLSGTGPRFEGEAGLPEPELDPEFAPVGAGGLDPEDEPEPALV